MLPKNIFLLSFAVGNVDGKPPPRYLQTVQTTGLTTKAVIRSYTFTDESHTYTKLTEVIPQSAWSVDKSIKTTLRKRKKGSPRSHDQQNNVDVTYNKGKAQKRADETKSNKRLDDVISSTPSLVDGIPPDTTFEAIGSVPSTFGNKNAGQDDNPPNIGISIAIPVTIAIVGGLIKCFWSGRKRIWAFIRRFSNNDTISNAVATDDTGAAVEEPPARNKKISSEGEHIEMSHVSGLLQPGSTSFDASTVDGGSDQARAEISLATQQEEDVNDCAGTMTAHNVAATIDTGSSSVMGISSHYFRDFFGHK